MPYSDDVEFTIKCKMQARWVPHFLSMLKMMQRLGGIGSSRMVAIFSDGHGDFRPTFDADIDWTPVLKAETTPEMPSSGYYYDAG